MSVSRPAALLATVLLAALLAAGCGSTSKAEYEAEVSEIGEAVERDLEKLDSGTPSPEVIDEAQGTLEQAADDLEGIEPPNEVEELHEDLVTVLRDTAGLFDDLSPLMQQATEDPDSMGEKELERMTAVTEEFADIEERMQRVQEGFEKRDYEIGIGQSEPGSPKDAGASSDAGAPEDAGSAK